MFYSSKTFVKLSYTIVYNADNILTESGVLREIAKENRKVLSASYFWLLGQDIIKERDETM